jgi:hypothetical protein
LSVEQRRESDLPLARSLRDRAVLRALATSAAAVLALAVPALAQDAGLPLADDDSYSAASPAPPGAGAPPLPDATSMTATPPPDASYADSTGLSPAAAAANYGKPRPFKPKPKSNRKTQAHPLPDLVPYPTSAQARRARQMGLRGDDVDPAMLAPSPTTALSAPIPVKPKPKLDPDPFAPLGLDAGPLRAHATSETDFGYNSNPLQASPGTTFLRGSSFLREEVGLSAVSDWSNHSFAGDMRLGYDDYFQLPAANAPDGAGKFLARIDVARDTKVNIDGDYALSTQFQTSPNLYNHGASTSLASEPLIAVYGGGLGVSQDFNRIELTMRGSFERTYWADARFADGATQDLSRDSYDDYGASLKASYALTPEVQPFLTGGADQRLHDATVSTDGYERNSDGVAIGGGSTFLFSHLLTGSASAGYEDRHYQDPRLADLRGPIYDISLIWTPTPLTKVTLTGQGTLGEAIVTGASGVLNRSFRLEVAHALRRDLTVTATAGVLTSTYPGNPLVQTYYTAGLKAEYHLSRHIVLTTAYALQKMVANQAGSDFTANILTVGLKLQE